jgi:hypothetical protein
MVMPIAPVTSSINLDILLVDLFSDWNFYFSPWVLDHTNLRLAALSTGGFPTCCPPQPVVPNSFLLAVNLLLWFAPCAVLQPYPVFLRMVTQHTHFRGLVLPFLLERCHFIIRQFHNRQIVFGCLSLPVTLHKANSSVSHGWCPVKMGIKNSRAIWNDRRCLCPVWITLAHIGFPIYN